MDIEVRILQRNIINRRERERGGGILKKLGPTTVDLASLKFAEQPGRLETQGRYAIAILNPKAVKGTIPSFSGDLSLCS